MATVITPVKSDSRPNVVHTIMADGKGHLYCTCEGWKWSKKLPKTCRHLKAFEENPTAVIEANKELVQ